MKPFKRLATTALASLFITVSQQAVAADAPEKSRETVRLTYTAYASGNPIDGFLEDSPLYHQAATELYRSSVQGLRQDIFTLQQSSSSSVIDSESSIVQKEINHLARTLSLQQEALAKYGPDYKAAREKVAQEAEELGKSKKQNQQGIIDKPAMRGLYEAQIKDLDTRLEIREKYLLCLEKSASVLGTELSIAKEYSKTLSQKSSSAGHAKQALSEKVEELLNVYEAHIQGVVKTGMSHVFPKEVMGSMGVPPLHLNAVHTERLFQLFARTLELPYAPVQTGADKELPYLKRLGAIRANLASRIQEDMFCFQLCVSMAQNKPFSFPFETQNILVEKLLTAQQDIKANLNRGYDLEQLKGIFAAYGGAGDKKPPQLLESILGQSAYGLVGLYISALEFSPVLSWNDPGKVSGHVRLKDVKSPEEFSSIALEAVFGILGRHINIQVLDNIWEKVEGSAKKPLSTSGDADFYI